MYIHSTARFVLLHDERLVSEKGNGTAELWKITLTNADLPPLTLSLWSCECH